MATRIITRFGCHLRVVRLMASLPCVRLAHYGDSRISAQVPQYSGDGSLARAPLRNPEGSQIRVWA